MADLVEKGLREGYLGEGADGRREQEESSCGGFAHWLLFYGTGSHVRPQAFCFLLEVDGQEFGFEPGERGFQTFVFVDSADLGFDFGGVAEGYEELVGGHAFEAGGVEHAHFAQDVAAGPEGEDGVADPGFFQDFAAAGFFALNHLLMQIIRSEGLPRDRGVRLLRQAKHRRKDRPRRRR